VARHARIVMPGVPLHIIQRGNDRIRTFHDDRDRACYRELLLETTRALGVSVHGYVLMPNHVHLLITPPDPAAPARLMQRLGTRYVRYVNTVYVRTGTLWEGRYRSSLVDSVRYLLSCLRYIELNPVRAGLVNDPEHYRWSSYRHHAVGEADALVSPHPVYLALGTAPAERREAYAALCRRTLGPEVLRDIRRAIGSRNAASDARAGTEFESQRQLSPRT
jgi:putative transposase